MTGDEQPLGRGILILAALVTAALVGTLTLVVLMWPAGGDTSGAVEETLFEQGSAESPSDAPTTSSDDADVQTDDVEPSAEPEQETGTGLRDLTDTALEEADRLREIAEEEARELRDRAEEEARSRLSDPLGTLRELFGRGDDSAGDGSSGTTGPHDDTDQRDGRDDDRGDRGRGNGTDRGGDDSNAGNGSDDGSGGRSLEDLFEEAVDLFRNR